MSLQTARLVHRGETVPELLATLLSPPQHPSIPLATCWADEDCPEGETGTHSHGNSGPCLPVAPLGGSSRGGAGTLGGS